MRSFLLPPQLYAAVTDYLAGHMPIVAAIVFGSAVNSRLQPDSDIDLALLFAEQQVPDATEVIGLRADLEQIVRRNVDLVVLNTASPILAFQAAKYGKVLFCRDQRAYERFLVRLITEYADFKRIRRPIEAAIIARRVL